MAERLMMDGKRYKIVYVTPALYMAGGVERVLTLKANYFAEHYGYDITIILTEGKNQPLFYPLSDKIKVINLDIGFEELWTCSFARKILVYLKKQRVFKKKLTAELMRLRPDITVSLLRREINFLNDIPDGSKKIGEIHINRANYRNYNTEDTNILKRAFAKLWSHNLIGHLKKLDRLVVLTQKDREAWTELNNVVVIPDPLPFVAKNTSALTQKRVIAIARYSHEKGIDLLLKAWADVERKNSDWHLDVFGDGDAAPYEQLKNDLRLHHCTLHGRTADVEREYISSSLFVLSSRFEGFGLVMLEAMSCGLPVVAFDCPWGPRSIIHDGKDGILAANGDTSCLASALLSLMNNNSRLQLMADNAIENAKRFHIDGISARWKQLFDSIFD